MTKMAYQIDEARDICRYCVIFDKNENANVFFSYKATMRDLHVMAVEVELGKKDVDECLEEVRKGLVYSMRLGDTFVMNIDNLALDFKNKWTDDEVFPMELISDFDDWRESENYMKIVKEEENVDLIGNKKCYQMAETF